ncbi:MAG: peptidase M28 family protein [Deltaproteobacteria bacterium]|nr:MAG: peptidase M28 family protein [Deltaproteobacteria bacterium]
MGRALADDRALEDLVELCDDIGHRLSGSPELDRAIAWAQDKMREHGLKNVRAEPVDVPRWVRGHERATLLGDPDRPLHILTLGRSVGTPEPVEAEVVVVRTFEELEAADVTGKIVLYDAPFVTYGETVAYRSKGPSRAAEKGAVGALVRSVGPDSMDTPHTGATRFADGVTPIPAAAITIEGAELLARLAERGKQPRVRLDLGAKSEGTVSSANVIGEIPGREKPEEIVVLGCHLDSWDVGQGAQDDGGGCMMALHAARLIGTHRQAPRRTVRVVFYTNEENGLAGAKAYAEAHGSEPHIAAIESDSGTGAPAGLRADIRPESERESVFEALRPYAQPLQAIHAGGLREGYGGADIGPLAEIGVPAFGIDHDTTEYFRIHHTHADTIDKIDPTALRWGVATMTVWAWTLAEREAAVIGSSTLRGRQEE